MLIIQEFMWNKKHLVIHVYIIRFMEINSISTSFASVRIVENVSFSIYFHCNGWIVGTFNGILLFVEFISLISSQYTNAFQHHVQFKHLIHLKLAEITEFSSWHFLLFNSIAIVLNAFILKLNLLNPSFFSTFHDFLYPIYQKMPLWTWNV